MRQTLIRVLLDEPWALWKPDKMTGLDGVGVCVLLLLGGLIYFAVQFVRQHRGRIDASDSPGFFATQRRSLLLWIVTVVALTLIAPYAPRVFPTVRFVRYGPLLPRTSFPIWGYGVMLLIGFLAGLTFAQRRAARQGISRDQLFDLGTAMLICGVVGARLFYLIQYGHEVFRNKHGLAEYLFAAVNLSEGGIVLYGGLIGGAIAYFVFCHRQQLSPLKLADLLTPAVFIGVGFGRIGCFLNGCCYGDRCELPWAVQFPKESLAWEVLTNRGFLDPVQAFTMPLHPTQLYSSINAFLLAWVTAAYFRHRRRTGDVFALGLILYPITRFTIEFLRGDEMGQFGTGLTISQLVSLGIFTAGVGLLAFLTIRDRQTAQPA